MDAFLDGLNEQIATRILEMFPGSLSLSDIQIIFPRIDSLLSTHKQFFNNQNKQITITTEVTTGNQTTK